MPGITPNMKDREHHDGVRFGEEVEGVRKSTKEGSTDLATNSSKTPRRMRGLPQGGIPLLLQFQSEARPAGLVPRHRFREFDPSERSEEDAGTHPRGA